MGLRRRRRRLLGRHATHRPTRDTIGVANGPTEVPRPRPANGARPDGTRPARAPCTGPPADSTGTVAMAGTRCPSRTTVDRPRTARPPSPDADRRQTPAPVPLSHSRRLRSTRATPRTDLSRRYYCCCQPSGRPPRRFYPFSSSDCSAIVRPLLTPATSNPVRPCSKRTCDRMIREPVECDQCQCKFFAN